MRTVFVLGFFEKVHADLRQQFAAELESGQLVWIGLDRYDPKKAFNVRHFSDLFNRTIAGSPAAEVLVVLADLGTWATGAVDGIVSGQVGRGTVRLEKFRDARSAQPVIDLIRDFRMEDTRSEVLVVSESSLRAFLGGRRILCVRGSHQPAFDTVFSRALFEDECFLNHCSERVYDVEKNSNLIKDIKDAAANYGCVLYAWHRLRTAPKEVKAKYPKGRFFEDSTPSRVVSAFRRAITGESLG